MRARPSLPVLPDEFSCRSDPMSSSLTFPDSFLWGASTLRNDWALRSSADGDQSFGVSRRAWPPDKSGADPLHPAASDVEIMRRLGLKQCRFSLNWSSILPEGWGKIDARGLEHYDKLVDTLLRAGIEPLPVLFHLDLPARLTAGFFSRDTPQAMAEFADVVSRHLGDRITHWATINDPCISSRSGHAYETDAPTHVNRDEAPLIAHHLLLAHAWSMSAIRASVSSARVSIGLSLAPVYPGSDQERDTEAAVRQDALINRLWLDPLYGRGYPGDVVAMFGEAWPELESDDMDDIAAPVDCVGLNYHAPWYVIDDPDVPVSRTGLSRPQHMASSRNGRAIQPAALTEMLVRLKVEYGVESIVVTANGIVSGDPSLSNSEVSDGHQVRYLHDHLEAVLAAIGAGVHVEAFCVGSLFDPDWSDGHQFTPGIISSGGKAQTRVIKESGLWYARIIEQNTLIGPG